MRTVLHFAGIPTAGLDHSEVIRRYEQHRQELEQAKREADRLKVEEAAAGAMRSLRTRLENRGENTRGLSDDEVRSRLKELERDDAQHEAERERQQIAEAKRRKGEELFGKSGCPARHRVNLDRIDPLRNPAWEQICNLLIGRFGSGEGFLVALLGKRGTGKTQLAVAVIHQACQYGLSARYIKAFDLFREIRRTYTPVARGQAGESEADVIDDLVRVDLLVIDEAHQRGGTDWEQNMLVNLLDRRYDAMKDTIIIGNLTRQEFAEAMGDSVVSRIHETGDAIVCGWPSYRPAASNMGVK